MGMEKEMAQIALSRSPCSAAHSAPLKAKDAFLYEAVLLSGILQDLQLRSQKASLRRGRQFLGLSPVTGSISVCRKWSAARSLNCSMVKDPE